MALPMKKAAAMKAMKAMKAKKVGMKAMKKVMKAKKVSVIAKGKMARAVVVRPFEDLIMYSNHEFELDFPELQR